MTTQRGATPQRMVRILDGELSGMVGRVTKECSDGSLWVRVKSRWGNHHHASTCKTARGVTKFEEVR